jgi:hypothetical protein
MTHSHHATHLSYAISKSLAARQTYEPDKIFLLLAFDLLNMILT